MIIKKAAFIFLISSAIFLWHEINLFTKQEAQAETKEKQLKKIKNIKPVAPSPQKMAFVKGGCFPMGDIFENGSSDELPVHEVCLDDFYIGKYEVTVGDFRKFVDATSYVTDAEKYGKGWALNSTGDNWEELKGINWRNPGFAQDVRHPVVMVSWKDAMEYIEWLSNKAGKKYRLPTEAEWEFAARDGGKLIEYAWGNIWPNANIAGDELQRHFPERRWPVWEDYEDGYVFTAPAGSFAPNSLGLYDMSGNVWEWCADRYSANYYDNSPHKNPKGTENATHRVRRGGSWFSVPLSVRTSIRDSGTPDERDFYLGFRVARSP